MLCYAMLCGALCQYFRPACFHEYVGKIERKSYMVAVNLTAVSVDFARNYMRSNPNATEHDLQVGLRNHLQELKKNGEKISKKQIAQASANTGELYKVTSSEIKATLLPNVSATTEKAVNGLNAQQARASYPKYNAHLAADHHYEDLTGLSKKARTNLHKRNLADGKAAFGGDTYQEWLKENHPELVESETPAPVSNKQNKKEVNTDYQSSKKRKAAKKQAEVKSQEAHRNSRPTKAARNAEYCTSQGIMTKPPKKQYDSVSRALDGSINISINEEANSTLKKMKEYYQGLEAAVPTPKTSVPTPKTQVLKPKTTTPTSSTVEQVVKSVEKELKGGKLVAWVTAIGVGVMGLVGIANMLKKASPEKEMNEVA